MSHQLDRRRRHRRLLVTVGVSAMALLSSCGSSERAVPGFALATGEDGMSMIGDGWTEPIPDFKPKAYLAGGSTAVPVDEETAAVLGDDTLAVVRPHQTPLTVDCDECSGLAATDDEIISTRLNYSATNGFDIVSFNHDLGNERVVSTERIPERATDEFPAENTESPVTLAADDQSVVVGYLSRNGGSRSGPSIIAEYDRDGALLRTMYVDGLIGRSAVSPDGEQLGLDVTGSGGACVTSSKPVVIDLGALTARPVAPEVPAAIQTGNPLLPPWFTLTDMFWTNGELVLTGEANAPAPDEESGCDEDPALFERRVDPATGTTRDVPASVRGIRRVGPGCTAVGLSGTWAAPELSRFADGDTAQLGRYTTLGQWLPAGEICGSS